MSFLMAGGAPRKQDGPSEAQDGTHQHCGDSATVMDPTALRIWHVDISNRLFFDQVSDSLVGWPRLVRGKDVCGNQSSVHSILDSNIP